MNTENTELTTGLRIVLLAREIQNQRSKLMNAIICRKQHPSYGYTKAGIRADLAQLEGMLYAYHLVAMDGDPSVYLPSGSRQAARALDIDLTDLSERAARA